MKNKIGWCNSTWNPVHGCFNNCQYCYARKNAKRFWRKRAIRETEYIRDEFYAKDKCSLRSFEAGTENVSEKLEGFHPVFLYHLFNRKFPQRPQRIFIGSMSEIYYWNDVWIQKVIEKVKQYPQHIFQFLSKNPLAYLDYEFPQNCWLGLTIIRTPKYPEPDRWSFIEFKRNNLNNLKFVCFEPLLEDIDLSHYLDLTAISWVIVGAETGNRKDKIIPDKKWLLYIIKYCDLHKIPIFIKDNLLKYYPKFDYIKEFPNKEN